MRKLLMLAVLLTAWIPALAEVTEIDDINNIQYHNRPIVVDIYATWCGPCRTYAPIFDRVAREYQGRVDFYRMDVDGPKAQNFMRISCVPTTVFLWDPQGNGQLQHATQEGALSAEALKNYINNVLTQQQVRQVRPK